MMMKKRFFILLTGLFVLFFGKTAAQTCSIKGNLPGAEGREIFLTTTEDYLSGKEKVIQKQTITKDGDFSFLFSIDRITPMTLSVNFYTAMFFMVPGEQYVLNGAKFIFDDFVNPFIMQPALPVFLSNPSELHRFIVDFNKKADALEEKKYRELLTSQNFTILDELYTPTDNLPAQYREFCDDYQVFSIGAMKASFSKKRSQKLGLTYLNKKKPDTHDYCYMLFFNAFFSDYVSTHSNNLSGNALQNAVDRQQSLSALLEELGNDPVLSDENVREMFIVKLLKDFPFRRALMKKILTELQNTSQFSQVKEAAKNVLDDKKKLAPGTPAPTFSLPAASGKMVDNQQLKGKYVYVNFFKSNCNDCLVEMEMMRTLYEKSNGFFEFVTICIDDQYATFNVFSQNHEFPWKVVYSGYNQEFIGQWQAKNLPYYVLIDENYNIVSCPALSPEEGIGYTMEKICWEAQRKQRK